MPIYEYECDKCGHHLEVIQRISDPPRTDCPECNTGSLRKLVSAAGFRLKGTGWYVTDFKDKPANKSKGSGGSKAGKPSESSAGSSNKSTTNTAAKDPA